MEKVSNRSSTYAIYKGYSISPLKPRLMAHLVLGCPRKLGSMVRISGLFHPNIPHV